MAKKQKGLTSEPVAQVTVEPQTKEEPKIGRPSIYTEELANDICTRLGLVESLRKICLSEDMPSLSSVMSWLTTKPAFLEQYTRAREIQAETQFDELIDIVDQPPELSHITNNKGELVEIKFDSSYVQWMKLRVDTRKWTAARMAPKKYGEQKQPEQTFDPMVIDVDVKDMMDAAIQRLELMRIGS